MAVDSFNSIRVDLRDIYRECEKRTSFHSRVFQNNELAQQIVISEDDYDQLYKFSEEAANLIADNANYITCATQTGFEAITADFSEENPNINDDVALEDLNERQKQTGEFLHKGEMDTLQLNVEELQGVDIKKFEIIPGFIRSAILEYILYKWYSMNRINDEAKKAFDEFEKFNNKVRFNTITNRKRVKKKRLYPSY